MRPLEGIRILDLSRVFAGPWATQMLGDLGAEVIKVERPGGVGDEMRAYGPPFLRDREGKDTNESPQYLAANRNKKSITIDFSNPKGRDIILDLAKGSDVLVENYKVGDLARFGLDYDSVSALCPNLIYLSLSGFGQTGPRATSPALDGLMQAFSGIMSVTGEPDGMPQRVGTIVNDFSAGMYAVVGILAALRHRDTHGGGGQFIDLSLMEASIALVSPMTMVHLATDSLPERTGNVSYGSAPAQTFECADGYMSVQAGSDDQFRRLCGALDVEELLQNPLLKTRPLRFTHRDKFIPMLEKIFLEKPAAHWIDILNRAGVMNSKVNNVREALEDEQVRHRGTVLEVDHPLSGSLKIIRNPLRFSETPLDDYTAPPYSGQHTREVLRDILSLKEEEIDELIASGAV